MHSIIPCGALADVVGEDVPSIWDQLALTIVVARIGVAGAFFCFIAIDPNKAFRADAEEGGFVDASQAGTPILAVVHTAEVTCQQSHVSL